MSVFGIQGQLLEVTVIGCNKLKNTEWISRQDPYVCINYGSTKYRTRVCTDGGRNPTFQEKFVFTLIEGLRELSVVVWNSNTITYDDLIGSGKIQLQKVLSQGYDDSAWPIQDKRGRNAGEVRLIMHYANANKPPNSAYSHAPSAPPAPTAYQYGEAPAPQAPLYSAPPSLASYPPANYPPPPPYLSYPPTPAGYPQPSPYNKYPQTAYPPTFPPQQSSVYPPPPPSVYPPQVYPPPPQEQQQYYPPGSYPPSPYPPRPY